MPCTCVIVGCNSLGKRQKKNIFLSGTLVEKAYGRKMTSPLTGILLPRLYHIRALLLPCLNSSPLWVVILSGALWAWNKKNALDLQELRAMMMQTALFLHLLVKTSAVFGRLLPAIFWAAFIVLSKSILTQKSLTSCLLYLRITFTIL